MATKFVNRVKIIKALQNLTPEMRLRIDEAIRRGAEDVAETSRNLAPRRSGRKGGALKDSIRTLSGNPTIKHTGKRSRPVTQPSKKPGAAWYVLAGDKDAYYAHMVEWGTAPHINGGFLAGTKHPGTTPQPFFLPAWRVHKRRVVNSIAKAIRVAVKEVVRGT